LKSDLSIINVFPYGGLEIYNVLVVDDAASNRKMIARVLKNCGCNISEAGDGLECVQKIKKYLEGSSEEAPIQLIMMDFEMPGLIVFSLSVFDYQICKISFSYEWSNCDF
jgi:CheY-like chemotaxis protein